MKQANDSLDQVQSTNVTEKSAQDFHLSVICILLLFAFNACIALLVFLLNMVEQRVKYDRSAHGFDLYFAFVCCIGCKSNRVER